MNPVIYIDVLFLINFVLNYLLLLTTRKICKNSTKSWRVFLGGFLGSAYAVCMFFPSLSVYYTLIAKLLFSAVLVAVSFHIKGWREFCRTLLIFYAVNFLYAGAVFGMFYFTSIGSYMGAVMANGVFYFDIPLTTLIAASGVSYLIIEAGRRIYAAKASNIGNYYDIAVSYQGRDVGIHAFLDTGNSLSDPATGKPVIVAEFDSVKGLLPEELADMFREHKNDDLNLINTVMLASEQKARFHLIPFSSLGNKNGLMLAFKPDHVLLSGREQTLYDVLIGVYNQRLSKNNEYGALLHPAVVGRL